MNAPAPRPSESARQAATRRQLLEAAAAVFAAAGFRDATVRAICERAGANIAAVHYHFGDKESLYAEVLRHSQSQALTAYPAELGLPPNAPPARRLKAFVHSFLLRFFGDGPVGCHGKLMAREMIDPTRALDLLVEERIRPQAEELMSIVTALLGGRADATLVRLCGCSIVSQCLFYHHCRPVVDRLFPQQEYGPDALEALAEHITQFSLAALEQFAWKKKAAPRRAVARRRQS